MRYLCTAIAYLVLAVTSLYGQGVPLTIKGGDVKVVQVDQVVVTKVDRTLVTSFPFTVNAKEGGAAYWWTVPSGVKFTEANEVLTITDAPKGDLTVGVKMLVVDFAKQKVTNETGSILFSVGGVAPPVPPSPPTPPPIPTDQFVKKLRDAFQDEKSPQRVAELEKLKSVYKAAPTIAMDKDFQTVGEVWTALVEVRKGVLPGEPLPLTRKVIAVELDQVLPTLTGAQLTDTIRDDMAKQFTRVFQALSEAAK